MRPKPSCPNQPPYRPSADHPEPDRRVPHPVARPGCRAGRQPRRRGRRRSPRRQRGSRLPPGCSGRVLRAPRPPQASPCLAVGLGRRQRTAAGSGERMDARFWGEGGSYGSGRGGGVGEQAPTVALSASIAGGSCACAMCTGRPTGRQPRWGEGGEEGHGGAWRGRWGGGARRGAAPGVCASARAACVAGPMLWVAA